MEDIVASEQRSPKQTPLQQLIRNFSDFGVALSRTLLLSAILIPVLLASFLTVDLPLRIFDHFFSIPILRPSAWLSWGGAIMAMAPLLAILYARRWGGDEASRVVTASWGVAALLVFAEISYLAPELNSGDFPTVRFIVAFVASAMAAQYFAPAIYDVIRGGGAWWRAPLYAAMTSYAVGAFVYYPIAYWSSGAPWLNWIVGDLMIKLAFAFAFLPVYHLFKRSLRPRGGYGGDWR